MFIKKQTGGIIYYTSSLLDTFGINHMFCTRFGGVSSGDFASLNVSSARKDTSGNTDSPLNIAENYRRALSVLGTVPEQTTAAQQTHSDIVLEATASDAGKGVVPGIAVMDSCDGIILRNNTENINTVCVKTADCVPILLADISTSDVCAVHAGWRGSAADIAAKAAIRLSCGKPENIVAAIGPCIGSCCYEIGTEVYDEFSRLFRSKAYNYNLDTIFSLIPSCTASCTPHLDLAKADAQLLALCGVKEENIDISRICTCCHRNESGEHEFFSHRGQSGHSGTFISAISSKKQRQKV